MKRTIPTVAKFFLTIIIFVAIVFYAFFNTRVLRAGPQITNILPETGSSFEEPFITVTGETTNVLFISVDDKPIFIDESGNFSHQLLLSPGLSIIELYARGKFDQDERILLEYVYNGTTTAPNSSMPNIDEEDEENTDNESDLEEDQDGQDEESVLEVPENEDFATTSSEF